MKDGTSVTGALKHHLKKQNKRQKIERQLNQERGSYWTTHHGTSGAAYKDPAPAPTHRGQMCPAGLALDHPAADLLMEYATVGCPTKTGKNWTMADLEDAIEVGPHVSALDPEAMAQLQAEVYEKEALGQAKVVLWEDIKTNPPKTLKISRIAMIPHKSRKFRAMLDLSYTIKLM